jgi:hypothetical protein
LLIQYYSPIDHALISSGFLEPSFFHPTTKDILWYRVIVIVVKVPVLVGLEKVSGSYFVFWFTFSYSLLNKPRAVIVVVSILFKTFIDSLTETKPCGPFGSLKLLIPMLSTLNHPPQNTLSFGP